MRKIFETYRLIFLLSLLLTQSFESHAQTYKVEEVSFEFSIHPIQGINSKYDDFSPVWMNDQLIFTSGRESNLVLQGENNWRKKGFVNVFASDFKLDEDSEPKTGTVHLYSKQIANNNHTGPVSFTKSGDTLFFTQLSERVKRQKEERRPQLYMAEKIDGKWQNIQALPFNNKAFSFGHPAWDHVQQTLYFASDMDGGKGGKDIYKVVLANKSWGQPLNLETNSAQDDMFPFIIGNDFFFSSNREDGKGNLDIYWTQLNTTEKLQNVSALNSAEDDHGLFIIPGQQKGFFVRRQEGNDNIYLLDVQRTVTVTNELAGKFTYRNLGTDAAGLHLSLIQGEDVVFEINADENGEFQFRDLPHENYTIKTKSEDNLELTLYDENGEAVTYLLQDGDGLFQYKKIDLNNAGTIGLLAELNEGDLNMSNRDISGQFAYEKIPGKYGDRLKVMLVNEEGEIVFAEYTDQRGNFTFKNVPLDENLIIQIEDVEEDLFLAIYDKNGNVIGQFKQNKKAQFIYKKINPDFADNLQKLAVEDDVFEHNTTSITGNFNYKKIEGEFENGLTIYMYNEEGILIDSTTTNERGEFNFRGLDPDESYLFKMKESDLDLILDDFNLHIEDRYGNVLADLYRAQDGFYKYKKIETEVESDLTTIETQEQEFRLNEVQHQNRSDGLEIYFENNSSFTNFGANEELQQLIRDLKQNKSKKITIRAYASCISTDQYNLWLSERRGNRVRDYLIAKGIDPSRISVLAYGESKVEVNCDEQTVPDEVHAQNRKVEIIVNQ